MLTDQWIIAQLLSQLAAVLLLTSAFAFSLKALRHWDARSSHALQHTLEQRTYLISSLISFALLFQSLSLLAFLQTVNTHLPPLIRGAMCATGILGLSPYGYGLLALKLLALLGYGTFLLLNLLDDAAPDYPLTPYKYRWVLPCLLLAAADLLLSVRFYADLSPDVVATCCSLAYAAWQQPEHAPWILPSAYLPVLMGLFAGSGLLLPLSLWRMPGRWPLQLLLWLLFAGSGLLTLKYHFVKYVYGLPTHLCLFDLFLWRHHGIGFLLFGGYLLSGGALLAHAIFGQYAQVAPARVARWQARSRILLLLGTLAALLPPWLYLWLSGYHY